MKAKVLSAGDIIEARCTRCREVLNHRIVAMVEDKVVRVECNTCNGIHNYYPPPSAKPPKKTVTKAPAVPRATKKDPLEAEREEWAALKPTMQLDSAIAYNMNGRYRVNHIVLHPVFGAGIVKVVTVPNKMQVLFQEGIKLLRCQKA